MNTETYNESYVAMAASREVDMETQRETKEKNKSELNDSKSLGIHMKPPQQPSGIAVQRVMDDVSLSPTDLPS